MDATLSWTPFIAGFDFCFTCVRHPWYLLSLVDELNIFKNILYYFLSADYVKEQNKIVFLEHSNTIFFIQINFTVLISIQSLTQRDEHRLPFLHI